MRRTVLSALVLISIFGVLPRPVAAQNLYGSIVGEVQDTSGAGVPGALVVIKQLETNQTREAVSSDTGSYAFANVAIGTYDVVVTLQGFQTFTAKTIRVQQNTAVRVGAKLSVGALQETVLVSAAAVMLQTETAAVQAQTTKEQLESLPTSGRSFQSLVGLMPGVQQPDYFQTTGINNPTRSMVMTVNGQPASNTVVRIDGVTATNQWIQTLQSYTPAMDAIESVSVTTNSFDADQGMAGGAAVAVQIKSGTNTRAGSAFEFLLDDSLRARNKFAPAGSTKANEQENVFGGTYGGPIKRNKLFYFMSLESTVQHRTTQAGVFGGSFSSVPSPALRSGNFADSGTVIYDPLTGTATGTGRIPFAFQNCPGMTSTADPGFAACNFIPASRISPIALGLLGAMPLPQLTDRATNNYFAPGNSKVDYHKIDTKVTWNAGNKLNMNARVSFLPNRESNIGQFVGKSPTGKDFYTGAKYHATVASTSIAATSILTPNFVVDGLVGFTRSHTHQGIQNQETCWAAEFNVANSCQQPLLSRDTPLPTQTFGWRGIGGGFVFDYLDPQYQFAGNAGWQHKSHSLKFGMDMHRLHINHYEGNTPSMTYTGGLTALSGGTAPNLYNQLADFLLGLPNSESLTVTTPPITDKVDEARPSTLRSWEFGLYVRDQWQIGRKLTASLGVRWEYYPLPKRADRGLERFSLQDLRIMMCGQSGNPSTCGVTVEKNLFTPRLGLAYRLTESTVIRVGFSQNPQNDNSGRFGVLNYPSRVARTVSAANTFSAAGTLAAGFPTMTVPDVTQAQISLQPGSGVTTLPDHYIRGRITSYNVSLQRLLPGRITAQVAYVANRQDDMTRNKNLNYGQVGGGSASQPYFASLGTTAAVNLIDGSGKQRYQSFQVSANRRMTSGLSITGAYTWSKSLDWWAGGIAIPEFYSLNLGRTAAGALGARGDTPHKYDFSTIYELPFGPGKRYLTQGALSHVLSNWQFNSTISGFSNQPFDISSSGASLNAPGSTQRADQVKSDVEILGGIGPDKAYFDPLAFKAVTEVRFGNMVPNSMRGPFTANMDASFIKSFEVRGKRAQFRLEVFNVTNTPHYGNPGGNVSNLQLNPDGSVRSLNGFGVITSTSGVGREFDERYIRLGFRLNF